MLPHPDAGPKRRNDSGLLEQLSAKRVVMRLAGVERAARCCPPTDARLRLAEEHEQNPVVGVEHDRARRDPVDGDALLAHRKANADSNASCSLIPCTIISTPIAITSSPKIRLRASIPALPMKRTICPASGRQTNVTSPIRTIATTNPGAGVSEARRASSPISTPSAPGPASRGIASGENAMSDFSSPGTATSDVTIWRPARPTTTPPAI